MGGPKKLYTNQKHISFQTVPRNQNNPYNTYNQESLKSAMHDLSHSALKLYLYFGYFSSLPSGIYLSKQDAMKTVDISEKSYFSAMKELKEKGYIIQDESTQDKDFWVYYEQPQHW